ncbi:thioesterase family protein [Azohydromonas australica]|uniref:thioesterase family protein n=1 Tax=Azohydromonas australica TaxID=364039 RepID=UPI000409E6B0|nr:thioesterase family protein [Azohydromonas australica]
MKTLPETGLEHAFLFCIPTTKTVPALYPEAPEFQAMPQVFATGYLVGLLEWACMQAVNPFLEAPHEQTLGTHIHVSHGAATPPGLEVLVRVKLIRVEGRRLLFEVEAHDGVDLISRGRHERCVIDRHRFDQRVAQKMGRQPPRAYMAARTSTGTCASRTDIPT